jgi:hypothetical protein
MKSKNPHAVSLGRLGGKAGTGAAKRRKVTPEMARNAALARWAKSTPARARPPTSPTAQ